jgi:hypothetical protein
MKRYASTLLSLVFSTLIVFSCSSLGRQEPPVVEESEADVSTAESAPVMPEGWKYETEITHKGSRSEGSVSRLFYRYNEIPGVFSRVIIGLNSFEYSQMVNLWDNSGYIFTACTGLSAVSGNDPVNSAELKRGWYETADGLIKKATPLEWVFVETENLSLWISPEKICEMISEYNLAPVNRAIIPVKTDE